MLAGVFWHINKQETGGRDVPAGHVEQPATDLILVSRDYDATDF
ncbi:hypothetical protein JCM17846_29350 [Iodidimonas nitroreducens]|uniref:Uncharacterized protein n=1 Tax=Iodidimonas nitroreducens TaxID=1236968 RepID=A0A5A7NA47_9PROT|nr:hypothetical protein AQ1_01775 [alpha proteobacterium Q-1]GER05253.1 hypothetical protein JCM17846_29350 [Iodidimonas nitroreducens]